MNFDTRKAGLIYPFAVETPRAAIAGRPITGMTYIRLSNPRLAFTAFDDGYGAFVRSPVTRMSFYEGAVEVHNSR